jgi:hypothetical protein
VTANILNKQSQKADKGWSSSLGGLKRVSQLLTVEVKHAKKCYTGVRNRDQWRAFVIIIMNTPGP